ncbi:2'-5' RNA ligase family protein [Echinicola sp. 20G]|uniref:2'-5' RNA ligase family protein n=1 Tax=Echinicola sp. 20G TaxID=2781961 RepID=UPI001F24DE0E|nr:2'-5' RNA ligase family protein [Echinicola sp. 20G]
MMKYFLAIVPDEGIQADALAIKQEVLEKYNAKHALKSPAHVTLKMPFVYSEKKEGKLAELLMAFFAGFKSFPIEFKGIGRFGKRIMYARVRHGEELPTLQQSLGQFCKVELKQVQELSDKAYTPHMTLVYSDLKDRYFDECWSMVKAKGFYGKMEVKKVALLKKINYRWYVIKEFNLEGK